VEVTNTRTDKQTKAKSLQFTSGEAHSVVFRSPLTNDGFRLAWNILTECFENKRLQVNSHLKTLFDVQSIAQESGAALKELQRTFQVCLTFIKFSGVNIENWDPILVYMCSLWEQSIQNKAEIPTWLELDSYLTERHRTLEAVDSFRSANFHHVQCKDTNRVAEFPKIIPSTQC